MTDSNDNSFILRAAEQMRSSQSAQPSQPAVTAEDLLSQVRDTIRQRRANYGPSTEHFKRTIGMLNALFAHKLKEPFTVADWPQIMLCDKMARNQEKPIADNPLDAAGYSVLWGECLTCDSQ